MGIKNVPDFSVFSFVAFKLELEARLSSLLNDC